MRIRDIFAEKKPVFSFEFFPPKTDAGAGALMATCAELKEALAPDFVSVTYGAGGSTRDRTHEIVTRVQRELSLTAMAHQTCVGATREDAAANIRKLVDCGVENILALRGDPPKGTGAFQPVPDGGLAHATDLIELLAPFEVCIGAACYPEDHLESQSSDEDLRWTRAKIEGGASFLITQLFFDNRFYWDFLKRARGAGIGVPIVPGIMPVTNLAQVKRFTKMCGASIPGELIERIRPIQDDPAAVMAVGIEWAIKQCRELLSRGAPGVHFYTLNKSHATRTILGAVKG